MRRKIHALLAFALSLVWAGSASPEDRKTLPSDLLPKAQKTAEALAPSRFPEGSPGAGRSAADPSGLSVPDVGPAEAPPPADVQALNRQELERRQGFESHALPGIEPAFQALASAEVAPAPGVLDRAGSLLMRDGPVVRQDLAALRRMVGGMQLPPGVSALNDGNPSAITEFFAWVKSAPDSELPSIGYGILSKGEIGRYQMSALGKGSITLNFFIRNARPEERAAVLAHELYHYWDKKVARNYYPNVSYGFIDPASKHLHEYDPYYVTSLVWQAGRPEGDSSTAIGRFLDGLPKNRDSVRDAVNRALGGVQ